MREKSLFVEWIAFFVLSQLISITLISPLSASEPQAVGGLASIEITPSLGVPLGGYGDLRRRALPFDFKGSQGVLDPLEAKVLILQREDQKLLLVSVDLIGMTAQLRKDLLKRVAALGFDDQNTLISATHTHSGPGAIVDNLVWEVTAMGRFQSGVYEELIERIAQAVEEAQKKLQPIELFSASFEASGLQRNRRKNPIGFDPKARFLLVRALNNGAWLGGVLNFAIHGTALNSKNLLFSADAPGGIRRSAENLLAHMNEMASVSAVTPHLLFINGAEGDVAPSRDGIDGIRAISDEFAEQARHALESPSPVEARWMFQSEEVDLPKPKVAISKCGSLSGPRLPLSLFLGHRTRIWNLRIGHLLWLTWPGEPTTEVGYRLKDRIHEEDAWILGLTNDHLAYFTTEEEYKTKSVETCTNFYGPKGTEALIQAHQRLSSALSNSLSTSDGGPSR